MKKRIEVCRWLRGLGAAALALTFTALTIPDAQAQTTPPNPATDATKAANAAVLQSAPFSDKQDFEDIKRGFIAPLLDNGIVKDDKGTVVYDATRFTLPLDQAAPDSVNPSLWRQAQLSGVSGLFKVVDDIYQVRGIDLSVITFIEGKKGITVVDPMVSEETAKAALDLYYQHRPKKPVVAVIYSHSHVDHFGGVRGVVSEADVKAGKVRIIAPDGFTEEAVSENVMAGNAMSRRASYMYGNVSDKGPQGSLGSGLGTTTSSGMVTLIKPTDTITKTGQKMNIDGHDYEFLLVPGTEAPSEMHFFISDLKALCPAENATHTLHNLYTLRGAKTRDAKKWVDGLNATLDMWGDKAEVLFEPHNWPVWGNASVVDHIEKCRDTIKYIHDQTLHLANQGYTMSEIGDMVKLPPSLQQTWSSHGYYGSVSHDARAVYNYYLGFFSADPADLNPLPVAEAAKHYVDYMGGADAVVQKAKDSYAKGEYRWVAQVMKQVVFADPGNQAARNLEADAFEQLGYQAESGPWRNFYLSGAKELRGGVQKVATPNTASPDIISAMSTEQFLDMLSIKLNGPRAADKNFHIALTLPDEKHTYSITVKNGVLNYSTNPGKTPVDCTLVLNRSDLNEIIMGKAKLADDIKSGKATFKGDQARFKEFLGLLDPFEFWFNIVTPNDPAAYSQGAQGDPTDSDNLKDQPPVSGD